MKSSKNNSFKNNICVGVTGANGYLGRHICRKLHEEGITVISLTRNIGTNNNKKNIREFSLTKKYSQKEYDVLLQNIDIIIHCAYDFSSSRWSKIKEYNVDNSIALFRNAKRCGIRTIFISSMAAYNDCVSKYGQGKLLVENSKYVDCTIRPGLVYGNDGGMMKGLQKIANLPVVPFIKKINHTIYPVHIDDLAAAIVSCVKKEIENKKVNKKRYNTPITIAQQGIQFKELLVSLQKTVDKKPLFIPIPYCMAKITLKKLEILGIKSRFRHDSLVSLAYPNKKPNITKNAFGIKMRKFIPYEV